MKPALPPRTAVVSLALLLALTLTPIAHVAGASAPTWLPQLRLSLGSYVLSSTPSVFAAFRVQLASDIATASGVDSRRVMITVLSPLAGGDVLLQFALMPPVGDDSASSAQDAANRFLARAANASSEIYSMSALRYANAASVTVAPLSSAASLLTEVSFGLAFDIGQLGGSLASFSRNLTAELVALCSAPNRVHMLSIASGSIRAGFIVSPSVSDAEDSARLINDRFRAAMASGVFVSGSLLSQFISGSIELRVPAEPMPPEPVSWWTRARLLTFSVGFGVGVFILIAGCVCIIVSESKKESKKKHPKKHPSQRSAYAHPVRSTPRKPTQPLPANERAQQAAKRAEEIELQHVSLQIARPAVAPLVVPPAASAASGGRRPAPLSTGATPDPQATPHRGVRFQDDSAPPPTATTSSTATPTTTTAASPSAAPASATPAASATAASPVVTDSRNGTQTPAPVQPSSSPAAAASSAAGAGGAAPRTFRLHFQGSQAKLNRQPTRPRQTPASAPANGPPAAVQPQ